VNGQAGASYALSATNSGAANTGYAGYFNNSAATGTNYGILALDASTGGTAGYFQASATSGGTKGVYGESDSTSGEGAQFLAGAATGSTIGIYGEADSTGGQAGQFSAAATSGGTFGVHAIDASTSGYGGYFSATGGSGTTYGVYSTDASASGYGGYFTNSTSTGIALFCSATLSTGCGGNQTWHSTSDVRLKKDIVDLPPARGLDAILKLRPVTFHWKDQKMDRGGQRIGLIAQEVEPLYPEIVGTDSGGMKSIGYSDLVVPLVKAVQQQQQQIDRLKAVHDNLQHEVDALAAKVAK
jgi:hypothetical protein